MSSNDYDPLELNPEAQRTYELLGNVSDQELRRTAKLLAGKGDSELFGQTEFELRDRVHAWDFEPWRWSPRNDKKGTGTKERVSCCKLLGWNPG